MSRGGRPSERAKREPRKRNLIGPHEILERIQEKGGIPDEVLGELQRPKPRNPRKIQANEAVVEMVQHAGNALDRAGLEHSVIEDEDLDPAREMAWLMSITNSMKESVPRKKWCRHLRAADPHVTEIRTMAVLSAGIWSCVECVRQMGPVALQANLWPDECDLCGAKTESFYEFAGNIPGCFVNMNLCRQCVSFKPNPYSRSAA